MADPTLHPATMQDRQDAIIGAAFRAFATYGFRRTSMDDIARGAGLSRTALYVHYRNKDDIFRSLTKRHLDIAIAEVTAAFAKPGQSGEQALLAAFQAKNGAFMELVLGTPHGGELLDAVFETSADLANAGEGQLTQLFTDWLAAQAIADDLGPPDAVAQTIMAALKGLKTSARSLEEYHGGQARLARVFARALGI